MFLKGRWYSERLQTEVTMARWGVYGQPVLMFPTAGGDAEEIERFLMIRALTPLIAAGRIKVYSVDSVAGRTWFNQEGSIEHRMWLQNQFHKYVRYEVVPAIRKDCETDDIPIWATGASIGAFHTVAVVCRFPDVFTRGLAMSGSYDLLRFAGTDRVTDDYWVASPLHFVPHISGPHLELLRRRLLVLASGEGRWENMGETWHMAHVLGAHGIPNRVDPWGPEWDHDWITWRDKLPIYLDDWTR
ncbi:MAG: alpha/beta hydrolase-fold protein [Myxococcota bacterium]